MWVVLDPNTDVAIARFDTEVRAVEWVANEIALGIDNERLELLRRCVIAPLDPERDDF